MPAVIGAPDAYHDRFRRLGGVMHASASHEYEGDFLRILILGGDGFCGWPTSLHLSASGHDIAIVDNLARRKADVELEAESLTPIQPLGTRLAAWRELTGRDIPFHRFNVAENYRQMLDLLLEWQPDAIVHFAEQRAAPYSMKSSWHKRYTVDNNVNATHNLLAALVEARLDDRGEQVVCRVDVVVDRVALMP